MTIWEDIYQGPKSEIPWLKTDNSWLEELLVAGGISGKSAVDLGCGMGQNSIVLAQKGDFQDVLGLDISPTAIQAAEDAARQAGFKEQCRFMVANLPNYGVGEKVDLILDWAFMHCLKREEHARYSQLIQDLSRSGTQLLIRHFSSNAGLKQFSVGPKDKVQVLTKEEVLALLPDFELLQEHETIPSEQKALVLHEMLLIRA